jgi:tetratricopeptide (TPR) repeat protein
MKRTKKFVCRLFLVLAAAIALAKCASAPALNSAEEYVERGDTFYRGKEWKRAIADYTEAIKLDPGYSEAYLKRGRAYYVELKYDLAIADLTGYLKNDPESHYAYRIRGLAYHKKGDWDRAIADFTRFLDLVYDPDSIIYEERGQSYFEKGDYVRARADWEQALQIDPGSSDAKEGIEALRKKGK